MTKFQEQNEDDIFGIIVKYNFAVSNGAQLHNIHACHLFCVQYLRERDEYVFG